MNINKKDFENFIEQRDLYWKKISDLIGCNIENNVIDYRLDSKWNIVDDELYIDLNNNADYFLFTVSSYSAKGDQLFKGESDGLLYVMAYDEDDFSDNTCVFVLDLNNHYKELND